MAEEAELERAFVENSAPGSWYAHRSSGVSPTSSFRVVRASRLSAKKGDVILFLGARMSCLIQFQRNCATRCN